MIRKKIGVSKKEILKWEKGEKMPSPDMLVKLSKLFNISICELLYGERININEKNNIDEVIDKIDTLLLYYIKSSQVQIYKYRMLYIIILFLIIVIFISFIFNYL